MFEQLFPSSISAYLAKRAVSVPWRIYPLPDRCYAGAVVIPSLAECANLLQALKSLSDNPPHLLEQFLILVVVNQRGDASDAEKSDNRATLTLLPQWKIQFGLENLFWVDAASPETELPHRQGVGLARKIGLDLALHQLDFDKSDPLLICLDADTLVQPDYLQAIMHHFSNVLPGGASIPYRHRPAADQEGQRAIDRYELFLRTYVLGLEQAGSPYAFHTVGSAMACRASAYVAAGGMNRRMAGEDFYFLQQLHKTSGVADLKGTTVHPSPRSSLRVPFGTGRAVGDMLAEGEGRLLFYQPVVFSILGEWLACVSDCPGVEGGLLLERAGSISPALRLFLHDSGFSEAWDGLRRHNQGESKLMTAFHGWFDAFRTMRLIHILSDNGYPRVGPEEAVSPLLERAGCVIPTDVSGQLELLRSLQQ